MKLKVTVLLSLLFILLPSVAVRAQTKSSASAKPVRETAAESDIRKWLDDWTKAFARKDVDAVIALYADDVIAYDVVPPLQYVGKEAYRADYQQFFGQYQSDLHVEVRDLHIGVRGDFAYAAGLELIGGTLKNGQKSDVWVRFTSLFRKVKGRWLDFHDHVSVPADFDTGKALLDLKP
ncbi:MAG TPA: nuclear transport factor 2 family protein [Chthoniobacterales bacterium]|nr:nuclear transport factor 2 family protein [Chthoniobacterales bacterium]